MEKGIIFTKDKKELDVFFLKSQEPTEPPFEYHKNLTEFDVNENSAGGGEHGAFPVNTEYVADPYAFSCCPVGPKGYQGESGINEDDTLYDVILDSVKRFEDTQLNIESETAQEILALVISKKVEALYKYKGNLK